MTNLAEQTSRLEVLTQAAAENWTLQQVADRLGLSRQRAHQLFREHRVSRDAEAYHRRIAEGHLEAFHRKYPERAEFVALAREQGFRAEIFDRRIGSVRLEGVTVLFLHGHRFQQLAHRPDHPGWFRYDRKPGPGRHVAALHCPNGTWIVYPPNAPPKHHLWRMDKLPTEHQWPKRSDFRAAQRRAA